MSGVCAAVIAFQADPAAVSTVEVTGVGAVDNLRWLSGKAGFTAALLPASLTLDLVGGRAVLAMRRAIPTRPLWPLKNSQSARPAALAVTFTRRAICDSDNRTPSPDHQRPPAGSRPVPAWQRGDGHHGTLGLGVGLGADHGDAAAAVVPALHVAPSESRRPHYASIRRWTARPPGPGQTWPAPPFRSPGRACGLGRR